MPNLLVLLLRVYAKIEEKQWRRQLVGTCPLAFERIFFARLGLYVETSCLVLSVYCMPYCNSALNSAVFALQ